MKRWLKYTLLTMVWLGIAAYVIFAAYSVRKQRAGRVVESVEIKIVDSSTVANLVTHAMVEKWIDQSKIRSVGAKVDSVQLADLEYYIASNGFVDEVRCFTTYTGALHVEVTQLRPVIRILLDGYNSYITADGDIFGRPPASSRYTPVVTGSYTPLFRAGFAGNIHDVYTSQKEELEAEMRRIEVKNIYPLYAERVKIREQLKEVNSRFINRRFGEGRKAFDKRVDDLKKLNSVERAELVRRSHDNDLAIEREQRKQKVYAEREKKLKKKYKDFINLITFVNVVENDKFWSSEIVQIVATESTNNDLRLELIPRSGDHTIMFGTLHDVREKLDNAKTFYQEVLPTEGWHKFKSINVEYKNQVVCK
ncbi:MAG: hypothetical protein R3Y44_02600 [Rikenellaceae bacterium]